MSPPLINVPDVFLINSYEYNSLFSIPISTQNTFVSGLEWEKIIESVPQNFVLPNPESIAVFQKMKGDSYNLPFTNKTLTSNIFVDSQTWEAILQNLPIDYQLPHLLVLNTFKPMDTDSYRSIFSLL